MTLQISRRGKQYLQIAQTLLRNAQSMTDSAVAFQLRTLAEDYQRRAEKASQDDAAKALARQNGRAPTNSRDQPQVAASRCPDGPPGAYANSGNAKAGGEHDRSLFPLL